MDQNKKGTNIANGILSAFVLVSGIIICAVTATLFKKVVEAATQSSSYSGYVVWNTSPVWAIGFAYIIPGLIGIIASFVRQNGGYIAQMVLMIISLVVMGILFFFGIFMVILFGSLRNRSCSGTYCGLYQSVYDMGVTLSVFYVLAWIAALAACITAGILACSRSTRGMVQQPMHTTVIQMGGVPNQGYAAGPGQGYVIQQGYGQPGYSQQGYVAGAGYNPGSQQAYPTSVVDEKSARF